MLCGERFGSLVLLLSARSLHPGTPDRHRPLSEEEVKPAKHYRLLLVSSPPKLPKELELCLMENEILDPRNAPASNEAGRSQAVSGPFQKPLGGRPRQHGQSMNRSDTWRPGWPLPTHITSIPTMKKLPLIHNSPTAENLFKLSDMRPESASTFHQSEATFDSSGMV